MALTDKIDPLRTLWGSLKNARTNWSKQNLTPNLHVRSINEITSALLAEHGIEALLFDVDSTLMPHHDQQLHAELAGAYNDLQDYKKVILSNSSKRRYWELGRIFSGVPVLRMYQNNKGLPLYQKLHHGESHIAIDSGGQTEFVYVGNIVKGVSEEEKDALVGYRKVPKPDSRLVIYGMRVMGVHDVEKVALIGDRRTTDISGGNQAGVFTILVDPFKPEIEKERSTFAFLGRVAERVLTWYHRL
jgi:predicted HAD superfamily phosphohydrolase YqeG